MNQLVYNDIRVQFLSEDIIRVERAKKGLFCDNNTFFIPDRGQFEEYAIEYSFNEGVLCFGDYELYLPTSRNTLSGLKLERNGKRLYSYKRLSNSGELPPLDKTPDVFALADTPRIIIPEGGYSKQRMGQYTVVENVQDIYLIICNRDARKLRRLYVLLTGRPELVRLSTLGGWNSKYYAYSEETAKQLILDYEAHNVPLDNMVIDTDWRSCEHGWGYDINTKLFPDMKRFLDFAHEHDVDIMFNDHPEPVEGSSIFRAKEIAYREKNLQRLLKLGVDTWWYDRNWTTHLISPSKNLRHETLGLYLFHEITKHFYQAKAGNSEVYRRPDIMGNVVNINNGIYDAITDSASHRYGIQWTGDIQSTLAALNQEVESLLRAGNNCIAYANADCGGHCGLPNKEEFIRWMQFGTLSPIFRPHCTADVANIRTREPWAYDKETLDIVREYNNLRYRLLPYIYRNAYNAYESGEPVFKALGWEYPRDKRALKCYDQYMLGKDLLFKPLSKQPPKVLKKENYTSPVKATYYDGVELKGTPLAYAEYDVLSIYLEDEQPEKGVPMYNFSARFETEVKFDNDVELIIKTDDGSTVWIDGEKVHEDKNYHAATEFNLKVIKGGLAHKIEIEYFQGGGAAVVELLYNEVEKNDGKISIYLPQGKWLDPFDGSVYIGGKTIYKKYDLCETPIFIRLGSLIPLAYEARNTKSQKWDSLMFDYYPDDVATDNDYLYEDDRETTAYKLGRFAKTPYDASFNPSENAYVIKIHRTNGHFDGENFNNVRDIMVKFHLINGVKEIKKVTLNGELFKFASGGRRSDSFPLNSKLYSPDGRLVLVYFDADADKEYVIKYYI